MGQPNLEAGAGAGIEFNYLASDLINCAHMKTGGRHGGELPGLMSSVPWRVVHPDSMREVTGPLLLGPFLILSLCVS